MTEPIGWVLYDNSCGFCRRWIPFWAGTLRKRGVAIAPIQSEWVIQRLNVLPEDLLFDLQLLLADESQVLGIPNWYMTRAPEKLTIIEDYELK